MWWIALVVVAVIILIIIIAAAVSSTRNDRGDYGDATIKSIIDLKRKNLSLIAMEI